MSAPDYKKYKQDNAFGWQVDHTVFIKLPFNAYGKVWKSGEEFNWTSQPCRAEDFFKMKVLINNLYTSGKIHHDSSREVQQKVGDRLGELNTEQLTSVIRQMNAVVKKRTTTDREFQDKRIKQSKIPDKQRGILRAWLNRNHWALEVYMPLRDDILDRINYVHPEQEVEDFLDDDSEENPC
jgi:hypothetical protein